MFMLDSNYMRMIEQQDEENAKQKKILKTLPKKLQKRQMYFKKTPGSFAHRKK